MAKAKAGTAYKCISAVYFVGNSTKYEVGQVYQDVPKDIAEHFTSVASDIVVEDVEKEEDISEEEATEKKGKE